MDYRKDMRTPKDRVDDELLSRLLRETDELLEGCGCDSAEHSHGSRRYDRRGNSERNHGRSCGCDRNDNGRRTGVGSGHNDSSCGCSGHGSRRNTERCCERDNDANGCGCEQNDNGRRSGHNDSSCGCGKSGENNGTHRSNDEEEWGCVNRRSMSVQTQGLPLVMSYCPDHEFCELYEDEEVLETGTLFRGLNFVFYGVRCDNCPKTRDKNCGCGE